MLGDLNHHREWHPYEATWTNCWSRLSFRITKMINKTISALLHSRHSRKDSVRREACRVFVVDLLEKRVEWRRIQFERNGLSLNNARAGLVFRQNGLSQLKTVTARYAKYREGVLCIKQDPEPFISKLPFATQQWPTHSHIQLSIRFERAVCLLFILPAIHTSERDDVWQKSVIFNNPPCRDDQEICHKNNWGLCSRNVFHPTALRCCGSCGVHWRLFSHQRRFTGTGWNGGQCPLLCELFVYFIVAVITANKLVVGPILRDRDLLKHFVAFWRQSEQCQSQKNKCETGIYFLLDVFAEQSGHTREGARLWGLSGKWYGHDNGPTACPLPEKTWRCWCGSSSFTKGTFNVEMVDHSRPHNVSQAVLWFTMTASYTSK